MSMSQPGLQHDIFKIMEGVWIGQDKMHPSPWAPEGSTVNGRTVNRIGLGALVVIQDYAQVEQGRTLFEGHGVLSWDASKGQCVMHWWDSMGEPPNLFHGTFENGRLSLAGPGAQGGQNRVTWTFEPGGTYAFMMEVSPDGSQWFPAMEGNYRKTG